MNGWVKLHRSILSNPHFKDPDWLSVWNYLLLVAAYEYEGVIYYEGREGGVVRFGGLAVKLHPGQLVTSPADIAKATGVNESKVYRVLKLMESEEQIEKEASNKSSMITVLKWNHYQKVKSKVQSK